MSGIVVIDASLAVKWLVREVQSDKAYALARSWAREEVYPMYDAHYLALAEVLSCELWTADERFYRAATSGHTQVRWIGSFTEG